MGAYKDPREVNWLLGVVQLLVVIAFGFTGYVLPWAEPLQPRLATFDLVGMVREFRESLRREIDLRLEGLTIRRFRAALADENGVWIPDIVMERTTDAVLTLEYSPGERVDKYAVHHPGSGQALAARVAELVLHQSSKQGCFRPTRIRRMSSCSRISASAFTTSG